MILSRFNIFSRIKNSENSFILNLLSGNADILDPDSAAEYISGRISNTAEYIEKGYLIEPEKEEQLYRKAYLDFIDNRENSEIQLFYLPFYSCNFKCSYCYQDDYLNTANTYDTAVIDSFFDYIDNAFSDRRKYLTLFGGEPLQSGSSQKKIISHFLDMMEKRGLSTAIVTNGYYLKDYVSLFAGRDIREIQVTLDGTGEVHDKRRFTASGGKTFNRIVEGIDCSLEKGFPVNLRVVLDRDNINNLPALALFAEEKGWTKNTLFKTQLGRNYELHKCSDKTDILFSRLEMYEELYKLIKEYPGITDFHKPAYSVSSFLFDNGELPDPLFDSCPGCKTEWAFDSSGRIFSCTATAGKAGEELGTFYPEISLDRTAVEEWEERSVLTIAKCRNCSFQLACGGGCTAAAKNKYGSITAADCRPVKELLELGMALYF